MTGVLDEANGKQNSRPSSRPESDGLAEMALELVDVYLELVGCQRA